MATKKTTVRRFAEGTDVSVAKSREEIETLLRRHGATEIAVHTKELGSATILYRMRDRMLRQAVSFPELAPPAASVRFGTSKQQEAEHTKRLQAQAAEWRRRWRAALLILKARLEAVESDADFETLFLGDIVLPDGRTMAETFKPRLESAYESGEMPPLMLGAGG
jgi:hypothetical protein